MGVAITPDNVAEARRIAKWFIGLTYGAKFINRHLVSERDAIQDAMLFMLQYPPKETADVEFTTFVINACRWSISRRLRSNLADRWRANRCAKSAHTGAMRLAIVMRMESVEHAKHLASDMLSRLEKPERVVLKLRFGIGCQAMTLQQLGDRWSRTRECIRRREVAALRNLDTVAASMPRRTQDDSR